MKNSNILVVRIIFLITIFLPIAETKVRYDFRSSIVKIYTTYTSPNYYRPWQVRGPYEIVGSGSIINGKRILTNAHVVSNASFIQVKRADRVNKYIAKVEFIAHDCDLAILKVEDETFFNGSISLEFGELPRLRDKVAVYGFPEGGEELCITEGVISRVEHRNYAHSNAYLLACQMDAAINPGSSGGPVIKDGKIIGVSFQAGRGENVSYMIPVVLINRFLKDIEDNKYDGIPDLCIWWNKLESPDLRQKYGLKDKDTGVIVEKVYSVSNICKVLQPDDIILSVDNVKIFNDGTIEFRKGERTSLLYVIQNKLLGEKVKFDILRNGKINTVEFTLDVGVNTWRLVPNPEYDKYPRYYIFGGFIFVPLTYNLINEWGSDSAPVSFYYHYHYSDPTEERKEIVVLLRVLSDEVNIGYQEYQHVILKSVNNEPVKSLNHLVELCEKSNVEYIEFKLENGERIVVNAQKCKDAKNRILNKYKISSDRYL
ncbi:MAG: serine protease [Endomicrobia bacterium]|nr:serine protease [Endomicrobiia bacterium]MDW8055569.1 serine protease [Elusimicrobiota bacterium]